MAQQHRTRFGSLAHYEKGGVEVINDDARNYVFSNMFEVASKSHHESKSLSMILTLRTGLLTGSESIAWAWMLVITQS